MRFISLFFVCASLFVGSLGAIVPKQTSGKPVFAHYMIGTIYDDHCRKDIVDAQKLGIDAFVLNVDRFESWATDTVDRLFNNADQLGFKLFFSFDMNPGYFSSPDQYSSYLKKFLSRPSYYKHQGKPLVSTFAGENVSNDQWKQLKNAVGDILIVPGFAQATPSSTFFASRGALDGVFNWNSWPFASEGKIAVSTKQDEVFQSAAKTAGKLFMMGISPLQFKHTSPGENWYRRGEQNLENRFGQVLRLQPDMLEIQTWNDAGESHYMGNIWPEPIQGSKIPAYTDGYDHTGYGQILPAFIQAYKRGDTNTNNMFPTNGAAAQGVFWHHTLLTNSDCSADSLGKPSGLENAENQVTGVVLVAKGQSGLSVTATSGSTRLGTSNLVPGFNKFSFSGMTTGKITVEVRNANGKVIGGAGPKEVLASAPLCNYNYQVVALAA